MANVLSPVASDVACIRAQGRALLPGLHDHHLHLRAAAAAQRSLDCAQAQITDRAGFGQALGAMSGAGWIRVVGYHESIAGDLDCTALDQLCAHRPLRVQHSSGKLWILNSLALSHLKVASAECPPGVERDADGLPTGRLWRLDDWLGHRLRQASAPNLTGLSEQLASYGVTGVTDASYTNDPSSLKGFRQAIEQGELRQKLTLMGNEALGAGVLKVMLDEDELPDLTDLVQRVAGAHAQDRRVAFHCVSHVELLMALTALEMAEVRQGARIEHGGVIRRDMIPKLVASGAVVVTQPGFITQRGERLRQQADPADVDALYPYGSLVAAGVPVIVSSDAPYGPLNPWHIIAAATHRRTENGTVLGQPECVPAQQALMGYLNPPDDPGGLIRRIQPGACADLCLLDRPLAEALRQPESVQPAFTFVDGELIYAADQHSLR